MIGRASRAARAFVLGTFVTLAATAAFGCSSAQVEDEPESAGSAATTARPDQLVVLAFDGSSTLSFWKASREFAQANRIPFTYFISGVYFIPEGSEHLYDAPRRGPGVSDIGFGGSASRIATRFEHLRLAAREGNEIASHANGHFDGRQWTAEDWTSEFRQFDEIFFQGKGLRAPDLGFGPRDIVGFRAPLLAHSPGLFTVLPQRGYAYDTSKTSAPDYWPEKVSGIWNFPLARLKIIGSKSIVDGVEVPDSVATLSMDYNFYRAQSNEQDDLPNKELYKKQMLDTYMKYFEGNYFGNRAPIHIGHHFSQWNGGAYWEAMQAFAQRVCTQPEVKCITYKQLVTFMEVHQNQRAAFQAGDFPRLPRPPGSEDDSARIRGVKEADIADGLAGHAAHHAEVEEDQAD